MFVFLGEDVLSLQKEIILLGRRLKTTPITTSHIIFEASM
jgi:hypothetical protein